MDVLLANGDYPSHKHPLNILKKAERIICCDGAADTLIAHNLTPYRIVGDLDSISSLIKQNYQGILSQYQSQEDNDLSKAVDFCLKEGFREFVILGACGGREDHSLANISLLLDYATKAEVMMATDSGIFLPVLSEAEFPCRAGSEVSFFSPDPDIQVQVDGVKWSLKDVVFDTWWKASLNVCTKDTLSISVKNKNRDINNKSRGVLVYLPY